MRQYKFERIITRREAINKYGRLGFATHREAVYINAENINEAMEYIKPFNYKKHIKYDLVKSYGEVTIPLHKTMQIIDEGIVKIFSD